MTVDAAAGGRPRNLWPLAFVVFVDAVGLGLLLPMLAYFAQDFGAGPAVITQLVAVYAFAAIVGAGVMGPLSDRMPRKLIIVAAMLGLALCYVGMALATSLVAIFLLRAVSGFLTGNEAVAQALVIDGAPEQDHTKLLGVIGAARGAGVVVGPLLGSVGAVVISDPQIYYQATLWAAAGLSAVAAGLAMRFVSEGERRAAPADRVAGKPSLAKDHAGAIFRILTVTAALSFGFGVLQAITPLYIQDAYGWGAVETGLLLALCAVLIVAARLFLAHRLEQMLGASRALISTVLIGAAAAAVMAVLPPAWLFPVMVAALCTAYAVGLVFTAAMMAALAPAEHKGAYLGWNQAAFALAVVISAVVNGPLFEFLWPGAPFALTALVLTISGLAALQARLASSKQTAQREATHV